MNERQASAWISDARLSPFLAEAGGDRERAVVLYEWHARLGSACFATLQHFEVLLRNAIDAELGRDQPQAPIEQTWLLDFGVLRAKGVKQVIVAVERLEQGKDITRARIVAGVSFGFWAGLFENSNWYEELWRQRLRRAFPHGAVTRKDLTQPLRLLQRFRNRLAHHDCLLSQAVDDRVADMLRIARLIDPDAATWIATQSDVSAVLATKP
jgi:hypothetical protein